MGVSNSQFGPRNPAKDKQRLLESVQPFVPERVLEAALFQANVSTLVPWDPTGLVRLSRLNGRAAEMDMPSLTIWAVTSESLFVLEARNRFRGVKVGPLQASWLRRDIRVERVDEADPIPGHPSFAVRLTDRTGRIVEMRAYVHSQAAFDLIEAVVHEHL